MVRRDGFLRSPSTLLAALLLGAVAAMGFSTPAAYPQPVSVGGGGGRFFTGAHHDAIGCDSCHEPEGGLNLVFDGLPERYAPGSTYTIVARWPDTQRAVSIVGEWVDTNGDPVGEVVLPPRDAIDTQDLCASGSIAASLFETDDGRQIVGMPACGASQLRLQWTAPPEPTGAVSFHVGAVASDDSDDPSGDLVGQHHVRVDGDAQTSAGCQAGGDRSWPGGLLVLLMLFRPIIRRVRRP
ncbi:MAG: hypothetical protein KUG77_17810 [Nannocystaceae bacterium]|nr:hypothetical protein [Nannocystaceae bacterium]